MILDVNGSELLRVRSLDAAIRRAQGLVAEYAPKGVSLAYELIRERREEAARELQEHEEPQRG